MQKILIAGAEGALGFELLKKLHKKNIPVRAFIHRQSHIKKIKKYTDDIFVAGISDVKKLKDLCKGIDIVVSGIGKSVSLFKPRMSNYEEVDYEGNCHILHEALKSGVQRFIYISIKGSDTASHLKIAHVHKKIQGLLAGSSISHTSIKPVGFFSGVSDLIVMAKRGIIPVPGSGKHLTNSIHQQDLAAFVLDHLFEGPETLEVGGPEIHSRNEMAGMIRDKTGARIIHIPASLIKAGIAPLQLFKSSLAQNINYFRHVSTHDMLAPAYGKITFKDYLNSLDLNQLP